MRISGAPSVQSYHTIWISASKSVFVYGRYYKSILVCVCVCRTWNCIDITRFLCEAAPAIQWVHMAGLPKIGNSVLHCWGWEGSIQFAQQFVTAVITPSLVGCVVWRSHSINSHTSQTIITRHTVYYINLLCDISGKC